VTTGKGQIASANSKDKTTALSEYRCVWLMCELANEAMNPEYRSVWQRPNLPIKPELKIQVLKDLQKIVRNKLVSFGPQKVRERELVANRIIFDGRLNILKGSGALSFQKVKSIDLKFEWLPLIEDAETLIDYGLALILDKNRPNSETSWLSRIHQCAYEPCAKYFLRVDVRGAGRPSTTCSPDHKKEHAKIMGRLRKRKQRENARVTGRKSKARILRRTK
jgi:hypothetical protein